MLSNSERDAIKLSSIKLPDGGDTHIHVGFGKGTDDYVVTTRIPLGNGLGNVDIQDGPFKKF
jgi:hypothetical protein